MEEKKSSIFEKIYKDYLNQIKEVDFSKVAQRLGCELDKDKDCVVVKMFGKDFRVYKDKILNPEGKKPIHAESVVLCKYILMCPDEEIDTSKIEWVSYKDFKDAAPFASSFSNNVEIAIARHFAGRVEELKRVCDLYGGKDSDLEISYEVKKEFQALPKIKLLLLFNDQDEEFPAECSVLFPKYAPKFLDMECLAILGWLLADYLYLSAGGKVPTIM